MENIGETILVTGGCGFIGSNYVRHLLETSPQVQVVVLDKLTYAGHRPNLEQEEKSGKCEVVVGDIADEKIVKGLFAKHHFTSVVNFAAESHVDRSIDKPAPFLQILAALLLVLLESIPALVMAFSQKGRGIRILPPSILPQQSLATVSLSCSPDLEPHEPFQHLL